MALWRAHNRQVFLTVRYVPFGTVIGTVRLFILLLDLSPSGVNGTVLVTVPNCANFAYS